MENNNNPNISYNDIESLEVDWANDPNENKPFSGSSVQAFIKGELQTLATQVEGKVDTNDYNTKVSELETAIDTKANSSNLSALADNVGEKRALTTSRKDNLVNAINEVNAIANRKVDTDTYDSAMAGKVDTTTYNNKVSEIDTSIAGKVDNDTYTAKVGELETAIDGKVEQTDFDALEDAVSGKANKSGYYSGLSVWLADNIKPARGEKVSDTYLKRTTAKREDINDSTAQLNSLKGFTIKNLVKNGNFQNGKKEWEAPNILEQKEHSVVITHKLYQETTIPRVANHVYYLSMRLKPLNFENKQDFLVFYPTSQYIQVCPVFDEFHTYSFVSRVSDISSSARVIFYTDKTANTFEIDKSYGVRLYDLTEMGCDNKLPNGQQTTVENCDKFFSEYVEGIEGATPTKFLSKGANLFDKNSMVLQNKEINIKPIQLVQNGNFQNGLEGWNLWYCNPTMNDDELTLEFNVPNAYISQEMNYIVGHKYYVSTRLRSRERFQVSYKTANLNSLMILQNGVENFTTFSNIWTAVSDAHCIRVCNHTSTNNTVTLDKHYGIRLIDLTAMGCEDFLPNGQPTNAANCEAYFGQGSLPNGQPSSVPNCDAYFGKDYIPYNDGSTYGQVTDEATSKVLQVPVLKATACNGYRIHGAAVKSVGWNAYPHNNGCFDGVKDIADVNSDTAANYDYSANTQDGYLYIQVPSNSNLDNIVVHPKWSYTDEQLNDDWYNERINNRLIHKDYWVDELSLPLQYRDGEEVKTITALHGLKQGETLYQDEIDLVNMKYIKRVGVHTFDGNEYWGLYNDNVFINSDNINAMHVSTVSFHGLSNKYQSAKLNIPNNPDIDKVFYTNVTSHSNQGTYVRDNQYTTLEAFKQSLADNPLTIYYLYVEQTYDLVVGEDFSSVYDVCDFGTEEVMGSKVAVKMENEYLPNLADKINNIGKYSDLQTQNKTIVGAINELRQMIVALQPMVTNIEDDIQEE